MNLNLIVSVALLTTVISVIRSRMYPKPYKIVVGTLYLVAIVANLLAAFKG